MPLDLYIVVFLTGAAALALWVDSKWPALRPGLTYKLLVHFILSYLGTKIHTTHITVALAILTYVLLVALWVIRAIQDAINNRGGGLPIND